MNKKGLNRRDFLITSASTSLTLAGRVAGEQRVGGVQTISGTQSDLDYLVNLLKNPPAKARPRTRWWWFGGAVTRDEISRELGIMAQAGLGGVEIQPVYPVATDDKELGIRHIPFFSTEWFELIEHAIREARRLGLGIDLTLGSGWPFGGPFVPLKLAARRLRVFSRDIQDPTTFEPDLQVDLGQGERLVASVAIPRSSQGHLDPSRAIVLKESSEGIDSTSVSDLGVGAWRVFTFIDAPTYMMVKRPTLGMEGYVIDHFSREAIGLFLRAAGDRLLRELGNLEKMFDAVFCDSLEVYGADWTPQLLEEFKKRRGYGLTRYLPSLVEELDEKTPLIRHDYHLTLSELTLDNFFSPMVEWASRNNLETRVQAHGAMGDILEAYGRVDVPEGEMIFGGDEYRPNIRHRRLASSAGHLYEKPVISAETYTWLRMPMFLVTLEMMKAATDAMFVDGINQIVNHGYPYSPATMGKPGWNFYASTLINQNATWWRHYPELSGYIRRCVALLQSGDPVNRLALVIPLADIFSSQGRGGFHLDEEIEKRLGEELPSGLRYHGYDFDLISEKALADRAAVGQGILRVGHGQYEAVLIPPCRYLSVGTLELLTGFVHRGGLLIFAGQIPTQNPGLELFEEKSRTLQSHLSELLGSSPKSDAMRRIEQGRTIWMSDLDALLSGLPDLMDPDLEIISSDGHPVEDVARNLGFIRRRLGATDFYLLANISADSRSLRVRFPVGNKKPTRLNPETGEAVEVLAYSFSRGRHTAATDVRLFLDPFESCFLVFGLEEGPILVDTNCPGSLEQLSPGRFRLKVSETAAYWVRDAQNRRLNLPPGRLPGGLKLEKPWKLTLPAAETIELDRLAPWSEVKALQGYSGWVSYETEFEFDDSDPDLFWFLDLGTVHETAEVFLNGRKLGACWKRPRQLSCGGALRSGSNHLRIEVANLWIHHVLASQPPDYSELEESYGIRWGLYGEVPPEEVPPSGLLGPVQLKPARFVEISI